MILGYTDTIIGETSNRYFDKYFQYSIDNGLNWSNWITLSNENLKSIIVKKEHVFFIRYKYVRSGTDTTELLEFVDINLIIDFEQPSIPNNFNDLDISNFIEFITEENLLYAISLLDKIYIRDIVPSFIDRSINSNENWEDEDYINFWWTLIYLLAVIFKYGKKLYEIPHDKDSLYEYLKSRGVFTDQNNDIEKLTYICQNFLKEIRRRGTNYIIRKRKDNEFVDGELLRLIGYKLNEEFIFSHSNTQGGWVIDRNSPNFRGVRDLKNCIKGYEYTKDILDLTAYPLINDSIIVTTNDNGKQVMTLGLGGESSIGDTLNTIGSNQYSSNLNKLLTIDKNIDYEIFFLFKNTISSQVTIKLQGYTNDGRYLSDSFVSAKDNILTDTFLSFNIDTNDQYVLISCILRNIEYSEVDNSTILYDLGNNLKLKDSRITKICPIVTCNSSGDGCNIYDFKVRPLQTSKPRIFLDVVDYILMYYKNNNKELSNDKVEESIIDFLIPYNTRLITERL